MRFTTFPWVTMRLIGKLSATVVFELNTAWMGSMSSAEGSGSTTWIFPSSVMVPGSAGGSAINREATTSRFSSASGGAPGCCTVGRATIAVTTFRGNSPTGCRL